MFNIASVNITSPSRLIRTHAPVPRTLSSFFTYEKSLCRLLPTPAARRTFPTLSLQSLCRRLDPYPAVFLRCSYPFLHGRHRPHVTGNTFGTQEIPYHATSIGSVFRGCSHSIIFRLPHSLGLQVAPTAALTTGRPGLLHHACPGWLPIPGCGIATCPIWAIGTAGLSPAGLQPCRLLLPALRFLC